MMVIALAAALLGGATYAWFTDNNSVGASFTAGTIVLGDDMAEPLSITEMAPGDSKSWTVTIENDGTLDMYYRYYFTETTEGELAEELMVSINGAEDVTLASLIGSVVFDSDTMTLAAGNSIVLNIIFTLPTSATCQGADFSGTLVVEATQVKNNDSIEWGN